MSAIDAMQVCHYRAAAAAQRASAGDNADQTGVEPMSFSSEFKEFALKGNVMDLAVGVIIGGAFGKIVDSLVGDLIMPVVGKIFGGLDFSNYFVGLSGQTATTLAEAKKAGAVFAYGNFITVAINFIILAFIIFLMVQQMNRMKREAPAAPPAPPAPTPEDVLLLREIRDALKK
jgi:large conductance mechanosensitive channel